MIIKMTLLSDAIFGNGLSIPGEEDISVLCDKEGFPYYKGGTFKGIFGEEMKRYLALTGSGQEMARKFLGFGGNDQASDQLIFSDFTISEWVKKQVLKELSSNATEIKDALTNIRTFTAVDEEGMVKEGSLRMARCVNKGLVFYSKISGIQPGEEQLIKDVLRMVKWIGTLRNRGFGKVRIEEAAD